ncbi:MAG TPA: ATP synthase F1 subunit epsilon [Candidatus Coproplasma avistercoris]|nr:ATP synthase F1 subunit epsilon [Candidatus Coproplasma avistercoris]
MNTFTVHLLSANRTFYEGECESLIIPAVDGQYGVLAGHSNTITALVPGKLVFRVPGEEAQEVAVSSGIMKVEDGDVMVLADSILRPEEIDEERAEREIAEATEIILQKRSRMEYNAAQAQLARAASKLKIARSYNRGGRR